MGQMNDATESFFSVKIDEGVAHVALNRPDKANSMTPDFWSQLPKLFGKLNGDTTIRAAVISGNGKHFTSGMDLATFTDIAELMKKEPGRAAFAFRELVLRLQDSFSAIARARFPVIAAVNGACIGAGVDLITACDIRLASADAFFAVEEINIGLAADVGTLQRLPKLISPSIAAELCFTGRRFSAAEAHSYGLLSQMLPDRDSTANAAMELALQIAKRSPLAIAGIKRNLAYSRDHSVADGLDYIATWNGGMLRAQDIMAAIQAKMSKGQADFADLIDSSKVS
jgi:enoyl-CoA hydratase